MGNYAYERSCKQADRSLEKLKKNHDKEYQKELNIKKLSKRRRRIFTSFFIVIVGVLYTLCLIAFYSNGFSFESYGGILVSFAVTGGFIGLFFSFNYLIRKKLRYRSEKRIVDLNVFFICLFGIPILFLGVGFIFASGTISIEHYPFNYENLSMIEAFLTSLIN